MKATLAHAGALFHTIKRLAGYKFSTCRVNAPYTGLRRVACGRALTCSIALFFFAFISFNIV